MLVSLTCIAAAQTMKSATAKKKTASHSTSARSRKISAHGTKHGKTTKATKKSWVRGQTAPDIDRTREIQTALIREHYLNGEATGSWDDRTRTALTKYQADHGWQSKVVPDSRALIKLGLGPSREGLLNPDTAAISPHEVGAVQPQPGGSASN